MRDGRTLKAVIPGGSSVPILLPDQLDIAGELRRRARRPGRCSDRPASSCSTTRPAWSGWPRTCCTSTATSRAASARRAAKAPTGCTRSCSASSAAKGEMRDLDLLSSIVGQHRRQDAVRVRRRRGDAGADDAEALPARVRGAHQGRALHAAGRLARARHAGGSALTTELGCHRRRPIIAQLGLIALRLRHAAALGGVHGAASSARSRRCSSSGSARTASARRACCSRSPTSSS